jgi:hypothetical protein
MRQLIKFDEKSQNDKYLVMKGVYIKKIKVTSYRHH